jgi:nucleotide-binding universal stress UspA family protein
VRRALLIAAALTLLAAPAASANGDPASDTLLTSQVFVGPEVPLSQSDLDSLTKTVASANKQGYPIRVALIPFTSDLGTAVSLWRRPQDYARFLGSELAFVYTKRLLIAMPSGFGVYHRNRPVAKEQRVLARVRPGTTPTAVAQQTTKAVRALAAADGITLPVESGGGGSDWRDRIIIVAAGVAILLIIFVPGRRRLRRGRGTSTQPQE